MREKVLLMGGGEISRERTMLGTFGGSKSQEKGETTRQQTVSPSPGEGGSCYTTYRIKSRRKEESMNRGHIFAVVEFENGTRGGKKPGVDKRAVIKV